MTFFWNPPATSGRMVNSRLAVITLELELREVYSTFLCADSYADDIAAQHGDDDLAIAIYQQAPGKWPAQRRGSD